MRLDFSQERDGFCLKDEFFLEKVLLVRKIVVPLHPLNEKRFPRGTEEGVL